MSTFEQYRQFCYSLNLDIRCLLQILIRMMLRKVLFWETWISPQLTACENLFEPLKLVLLVNWILVEISNVYFLISKSRI